MKNTIWILYLFTDSNKSEIFKIMEFKSVKDIAYVINMAEGIGDIVGAIIMVAATLYTGGGAALATRGAAAAGGRGRRAGEPAGARGAGPAPVARQR